ncbi:MAG: DUF3088 family protein [Litorimonas sp.]
MSKDTFFLLAPGFEDKGRREYCPECAEVWGLLSYFPAIKHSADIQYQPIAKPRAQMVQILGDKNQNCPTLVLHADSPSFENCGIMQKNGHRFINNARDIGLYYAQRFATPAPRGHQRS